MLYPSIVFSQFSELQAQLKIAPRMHQEWNSRLIEALNNLKFSGANRDNNSYNIYKVFNDCFNTLENRFASSDLVIN